MHDDQPPEPTVIAGVDGRPGGRDAIALAAALATATGSRLILAHTVCYELHLSRAHDRGARDRALALLEREARDAGMAATQLEIVVEATAAAGLARLARAQRANLLVVGAAHRRGLARAVIGDDAAAVVSAAPCPVAIAPPGWSRERRTLSRVAVAYDDAPGSRPALRLAAEFAAALNAALQVVDVVEPAARRTGERPIDARRALGRRLEAARVRAERAATRLPVPATVTVRAGGPAEQLLALSGETDLLVVGSHRRGAFGRLLYGSVSAALARGARSPLLIAPTHVPQLGAVGAEERTSS